jgi:NAD(P)-dependent dehydrogenase (short-subunit alcohol dehydrogenase family)
VNIASLSGIRGARAGAAYTASKFGLVGLTQNVAATFGPSGIRCNAVCPGGITTNIADGLVPSSHPERAEFYRRDAGRPGEATPEQIADVAYYLATDASRVNGAVMPVDGGWSAY